MRWARWFVRERLISGQRTCEADRALDQARTFQHLAHLSADRRDQLRIAAQLIDAAGKTLLPGYVMMYEHLVYLDHTTPVPVYSSESVPMPPLYLARWDDDDADHRHDERERRPAGARADKERPTGRTRHFRRRAVPRGTRQLRVPAKPDGVAGTGAAVRALLDQ
jgi:hypothetical protein